MNNIKQALESAEKLISKAIIFESEAQEYLSESNYELNGCLGDCAATIAVNGKQVLADVKAALEHLQTNALDKCESETSSQPVGYVWDKDKKYCYVIDTDIQFKHGTKLFTSPQPRDWVGLSDEDIEECSGKMHSYTTGFDFAREIEAKLKQLNTKG